ncbi:site-specific integrase, partial [Streptomyces sp. NPDC002537]
MTTLAPVMQGFFTERLAQRRVSTHTVAAYRDTFRLLLEYAHRQLGRPPSALELTDIDAVFVGRFLDHLEHDRNNSVTTRNARLAAIHSLSSFSVTTDRVTGSVSATHEAPVPLREVFEV